LSQNWYYNAGEKYIANGSASRYAQTGAEHVWSSAGNNTSGAGAGLSWQERMRIDSSGLGTALLNVAGGIDVADSDYPYLKLKLASNESIVEASGQYQNMTVGGTGANAYVSYSELTDTVEVMRLDRRQRQFVGGYYCGKCYIR
jgi:hypothetical protein